MPDNNQVNIPAEESPGPGEIYYDQSHEDTLIVGLRGSWKIGEKLPPADDVQQQIDSRQIVRRVAFDTRQLTAWDSGLLTFPIKVVYQSQQNKIEIAEAIKEIDAMKTAE